MKRQRKDADDNSTKLYCVKSANGLPVRPVPGLLDINGLTCYGCKGRVIYVAAHFTTHGCVRSPVRSFFRHKGDGSGCGGAGGGESPEHSAAKAVVVSRPDIRFRQRCLHCPYGAVVDVAVPRQGEAHPERDWKDERGTPFRFDVAYLDEVGHVNGVIEVRKTCRNTDDKNEALGRASISWVEVQAVDVLTVLDHAPEEGNVVYALRSIAMEKGICSLCIKALEEYDRQRVANQVKKEQDDDRFQLEQRREMTRCISERIDVERERSEANLPIVEDILSGWEKRRDGSWHYWMSPFTITITKSTWNATYQPSIHSQESGLTELTGSRSLIEARYTAIDAIEKRRAVMEMERRERMAERMRSDRERREEKAREAVVQSMTPKKKKGPTTTIVPTPLSTSRLATGTECADRLFAERIEAQRMFNCSGRWCRYRQQMRADVIDRLKKEDKPYDEVTRLLIATQRLVDPDHTVDHLWRMGQRFMLLIHILSGPLRAKDGMQPPRTLLLETCLDVHVIRVKELGWSDLSGMFCKLYR